MANGEILNQRSQPPDGADCYNMAKVTVMEEFNSHHALEWLDQSESRDSRLRHVPYVHKLYIKALAWFKVKLAINIHKN